MDEEHRDKGGVEGKWHRNYREEESVESKLPAEMTSRSTQRGSKPLVGARRDNGGGRGDAETWAAELGSSRWEIKSGVVTGPGHSEKVLP